MEGNEKEKPPEWDGNMDVETISRKRSSAAALLPSEIAEHDRTAKKVITNPESANPSISNMYKHPSLDNNSRGYSKEDCGPFIVHVSRESVVNSSLSLKPIKVGLIFMQNKISNITKDGIKSIGRNRVSVEFKSAQDANNFITNPCLARHQLTVSIPAYNISRMGLVRGVPVEWSMEEFVNATDLAEGSNKILKARRLHRKVLKEDGTPSWIPTQSVVLTMQGQSLPSKIYAVYTSLPVEVYILPTIQCRKCVRFGHIQNQCRSDARCYRCAQKHPGDQCKVTMDNATCFNCSGKHFATDNTCPEFSRQKAIKTVMSEQNISYAEASTRYGRVRRPYADVAKVMFAPISEPSALSPSHQTYTSLPPTPVRPTSYRKRVNHSPRPRSPTPVSYDQHAHHFITSTPRSEVPNGQAYPDLAQRIGQFTPNEGLMELLIKLLSNIIAKFSDVLPNDVAPLMITLTEKLTNGTSFHNPSSLPSME